MQAKSAIAGILGMLGALVAPASAQVVGDAIIATVNDKPISTFDLQQRMRLLMITAGGPVPEGAEMQYQQQALRDLIEEELKRQEAARYELVIDDGEVNEELAQIAQAGGVSIDMLARQLSSQGIAIETLMEKIRAERAWETLVRGRFKDRVSIKESEIDDMLGDMRQEATQEQYLLSEICLPVDNPQQGREVYQVGMQMLQQMQQGVPFQALAQRFSVCPSAARGGDLGWMRMPEMEQTAQSVVPQLSEGNVSAPVASDDGDMLKLIALRAKREAAEKGDPSYELAYAGVPKGFYSLRQAEEKLRDLPLTNPCDGGTLSADLGDGIGVDLFDMRPISEIREPFQDLVLDLERGDLSDIIQSTDAYHIIYVCEMDEGLGLPRRRVVENRLEAKQFELLSRRYLRDVERDSAVTFRVPQQQGPEQAPAQAQDS